MNIEQLTEYIIDCIKKVKGQVVNLDGISEMLKEHLQDSYTSEIGIAVKNNLRDHESIDIFREGDCISDHKYHYCVGNWVAIRGLYTNGVDAKAKIGLLSWQRFEDDWIDD